jgi:hypothetical protein
VITRDGRHCLFSRHTGIRIEGSDGDRAVCSAHIVRICKLDLIHIHLCTRDQVVLKPDYAKTSFVYALKG